jgi:hypothetical protein
VKMKNDHDVQYIINIDNNHTSSHKMQHFSGSSEQAKGWYTIIKGMKQHCIPETPLSLSSGNHGWKMLVEIYHALFVISITQINKEIF